MIAVYTWLGQWNKSKWKKDKITLPRHEIGSPTFKSSTSVVEWYSPILTTRPSKCPFGVECKYEQEN